LLPGVLTDVWGAAKAGGMTVAQLASIPLNRMSGRKTVQRKARRFREGRLRVVFGANNGSVSKNRGGVESKIDSHSKKLPCGETTYRALLLTLENTCHDHSRTRHTLPEEARDQKNERAARKRQKKGSQDKSSVENRAEKRRTGWRIAFHARSSIYL
jgi:hypothetical protein